MYAVGRSGLAYDQARTIPAEHAEAVLAVRVAATGAWVVASRAGGGHSAVAAMCRVVADTAASSQCRLEVHPPRLEIEERDGLYVLVDDGPRDQWRYVFVPRDA